MTPAEAARIASGLTIEEAARRARVCPAYVRRAEKHGACYTLALRLSRIYGCPVDHFLNVERRNRTQSPENVGTFPGTPTN
jgi:hypothetical protein